MSYFLPFSPPCRQSHRSLLAMPLPFRHAVFAVFLSGSLAGGTLASLPALAQSHSAPNSSMELLDENGDPKPAISGPIESSQGKKESLLNYQQNPGDKPSSMPDSFYQTLTPLLATGQYAVIVQNISRAKAQDDPKTLRWYEAAAREGHVRLIWELAEGLARTGRFEKSTYWAYAALIGTYQETSLCTMNEIQFAAADLIRTHPASRDASHQNGQISREALRFAFQFMAQAPSQSPEWLCKGYANNQKSNQAYFYDPPYWADLRLRARERLARQLLNPPNGWVPGLAESVAKGQFPAAVWARGR